MLKRTLRVQYNFITEERLILAKNCPIFINGSPTLFHKSKTFSATKKETEFIKKSDPFYKRFTGSPQANNKEGEEKVNEKDVENSKDIKSSANTKPSPSEKERIAEKNRTIEWFFVKKILNLLRSYLIPYVTEDKRLNSNLLKMYSLLGVSKICALGMPLCMKYGINMLTSQATALTSIYYFLGYGGRNVADAKRGTLVTGVVQDAWRLLSLQTYNHLLNMDVSFHLSGTKASLFSIHKAKKGIETNIKFTTNMIIPSTIEVIIGSYLLATHAGTPFMLVFLASLASFVAFTRYAGRVRKNFVAKQKEQDKILDYLVTEALSNYFLVKHFNAEKIELAKYEDVLNKYHSFAQENAKALGFINIGQRAIIAAGLTINLILGAYGCYIGTMTPGDLVLVQTLMAQVFFPLHNLGVLSREWVDSYFEIRELFRVLEQKPKFFYFII